jgi:hypothetical protein
MVGSFVADKGESIAVVVVDSIELHSTVRGRRVMVHQAVLEIQVYGK